MKKYNIFYEEDGAGSGLSESVLYDTSALSSAISDMNTAFDEVSKVFKDMSQDTFFSGASWECEAADKAKQNYETINKYCDSVKKSYGTYTAFLQDAVDTNFTDVGTKIVNAINVDGD